MQLERIKRVNADTIHDFGHQFGEAEEPIVISNTRTAANAGRWTLEALRDAFGKVTVPVRDSDDELNVFFAHEQRRAKPTRRMTLAGYLEMIQSATVDRRPPYAGNIRIFNDPIAGRNFERLVADCHFPRWSTSHKSDEYRLWIGAAGQRSTIHNDPYHNFNAQIIGSKRFIVFSPDQHPALYPVFFHRDMWASPVDPLNPDLRRYPKFENARGRECTLDEGDVLFLPRFWWHYVEAVTSAMNVNRWVLPEDQRNQWWHQQPDAKAFISYSDLLDSERRRYGALPPELQEFTRVDFDEFQADLLRRMADGA